ncbi:aldehyde dehydrogenase family 1 member A3-like [Drosophila pseudoobscura]|uniref:Aldehyde dehydrogenase family 1 member A3-like n=1 Tax=Drosophila pseudoobscura pseudoobscura TaxID=46245 RepID=A0A6I8UYT3_DROPS|nr:aldehyde dehydrogenase family 1 member A3 [Drosophila pseudoobscura]
MWLIQLASDPGVGRQVAQHYPLGHGPDYAVETAHFGLFFNMGQCCCAGSRTFVEDIFIVQSIIVPRHWWHYVEATETSLSLNYWVPLKDDMDLALDEFLVNHIVESFVKGESEQTKQYLLNPNQLEDISSTPSELFAQFQQAVQNAESEEHKRKLWETDYLTQSKFRELLARVRLTVRHLEVMPKEEYKLLLEFNSKRLQTETRTATESLPISSTLELLISSMCAPRTIAGMKREFFRRLYT